MIKLDIDPAEMAALSPKCLTRALMGGMRKSATTATRDMQREAVARVRAVKRIKAKEVKRAVIPHKNRGRRLDDMAFGVDVSNQRVRLVGYPNRQTKQGVSVEVSVGKRIIIKSAFLATMKSKHKGIFIRRGAKRLPISEMSGARPIDMLKKKENADGVLQRGRVSFTKRFDALLPMELDKAKNG